MKLSEYIFDLITSRNPNLIGEILREKFFNQDREKGKLGGYSTSELRDNVTRLPDKKNMDYGIEGVGITVLCARLEDIEMEWFYEHDGELTFYFPDGSILVNNDCKKTGNWEWGSY